MNRSALTVAVLLTASILAGGCGAHYRWRSTVPANVRTVAVPTFRNESEVQQVGSIATRQLLREFQREGTFKIASIDQAALEIQGVVKSISSGVSAYDRRSGMRISASNCSATFSISVIDKRSRKVIIDNKAYTGESTYTSGADNSTALRDAMGRMAEDMAQQVVDDVLNMKFEGGEE